MNITKQLKPYEKFKRMLSLLDEFNEQNENKLLDKELHRELLVRFSTPEDLDRIKAELGDVEPLDREQLIVSLVRAIELTGQREKILHHIKNIPSPEPNNPPKMEQLSGWWRFDEGSGSLANDSSGNKNVGELSNPSPNWITEKAGLSGLHFDGSTFVKVKTAPSLEPDHLTVAMWAKGNPQDVVGALISKGRDGTAAASFALYTGPNRGLQFYIYDGSAIFHSPEQPATIWDNQWFHVVGSYDGSKVRLYINGDEVLPETEDVQTTIQYDFPHSSIPVEDRRDLRIGTYYQRLGGIFVGEIDDVMLWNVALTSEEIKTLVDLAGVLKSLDDQTLESLTVTGDFNLDFFVKSDTIVEKAHTDQALIDKLMGELPHSIVFQEDGDEKLQFDSSQDSPSAEMLADLNVRIQASISGGPEEERNKTKIWLVIRTGEYKFKQIRRRVDLLIEMIEEREVWHDLLPHLFKQHPRQLMIEFRAQISELWEVIERLSHLDNRRHPFFLKSIHNVLSGLEDEELREIEQLLNSTNVPRDESVPNDESVPISLTTTLSIFQLKSENKKALAELHYVIDPIINAGTSNKHRVMIDRGSENEPSIVPFNFRISQTLNVALSRATFNSNVNPRQCVRETQQDCHSRPAVSNFTMAITIPSDDGPQSMEYTLSGMISLMSNTLNSPAQTLHV